MPVTNLIMDFDGTCTVIPEIEARFLDDYFKELNSAVFQNMLTTADWKDALNFIKQASPRFGWTIKTTPAAPAAADPYILAFEAASLLMRKKGLTGDIPVSVFKNASEANPAPWRPEAKAVFEEIIGKGVQIIFISNTGSKTVEGRIKTLFNTAELPTGFRVNSGAEKFRIGELPPESIIPEPTKQKFEQLPVGLDANIGRPIYVRRSAYFEAICRTLNNDLNLLPTTLFCGDIWEMDLAMPYLLGANIHFIERAAPYETYDYERNAILNDKYRCRLSNDLKGLLDWL